MWNSLQISSLSLYKRAFPAFSFKSSPLYFSLRCFIFPSSLRLSTRFLSASLCFFHGFSLAIEKLMIIVKVYFLKKINGMVSPKHLLPIVGESLSQRTMNSSIVNAILQSIPFTWFLWLVLGSFCLCK